MRIERRIKDFFNRRQVNCLVFSAEMISVHSERKQRKQRQIQAIAPTIAPRWKLIVLGFGREC